MNRCDQERTLPPPGAADGCPNLRQFQSSSENRVPIRDLLPLRWQLMVAGGRQVHEGHCARWWRGSLLKGALEAWGHWVVAGRPKRPCNADVAARPSLPSSLCFGRWNKWACQRRCLQWPCVQAGGVGLIMRLASCWAWGRLLEIYEYQCGYLWKRNHIPLDIWLALKGVRGFKKGWYDMEFKLWSSLHGSPVRASDSAIYNWRRKHTIVSLISNIILQNFKMTIRNTEVEAFLYVQQKVSDTVMLLALREV